MLLFLWYLVRVAVALWLGHHLRRLFRCFSICVGFIIFFFYDTGGVESLYIFGFVPLTTIASVFILIIRVIQVRD